MCIVNAIEYREGDLHVLYNKDGARKDKGDMGDHAVVAKPYLGSVCVLTRGRCVGCSRMVDKPLRSRGGGRAAERTQTPHVISRLPA